MRRADAARAAGEWLEKLGLGDRRKDKLDSLSKGNQQKVQFAAAVLHKPSFAVLDEPFSGFDPVNQEKFLGYIEEMREEGSTILLSAHQMPLVERVAGRILLIDRGREVLSGKMDSIRDEVRAGRRLVLDAVGDFEVAALERCAGVRSVVSVEGSRITLELAGEGTLNGVLIELSECLAIGAIHDEESTLHDIYVEAVQRSGDAEA